jgi:hypothetical protein
MKQIDSHVFNIEPGANPAMESYNASAVKIYNVTSSLVRFENKNIEPTGVVVVNSKVVGLAPGCGIKYVLRY